MPSGHAASRRAATTALGHLGEIQEAIGDHAAALSHYRQALSLCRQMDFQIGEADILAHLGTVQRDTGDYEAATANLTASVALYRLLDHRPFIAGYLNELG